MVKDSRRQSRECYLGDQVSQNFVIWERCSKEIGCVKQGEHDEILSFSDMAPSPTYRCLSFLV